MWMVYSINLKKKNEDTFGREREMEEWDQRGSEGLEDGKDFGFYLKIIQNLWRVCTGHDLFLFLFFWFFF